MPSLDEPNVLAGLLPITPDGGKGHCALKATLAWKMSAG